MSPRAFNLAEGGLEGLALGEPTTLYHGTTRTFGSFDVSKSRKDLVDQFYGDGIFLTPSKKVAWSYADANRNIGFDPEIIADLESKNPKAGRFMRLLYEKGNDAWDMFPREFFHLGPNDSYMEAFEKYIGGVDPNTIADVARLIIGSKLPHGLGEDEALNIFDTSTGLPDYIYKSLDEIGLDSRIYRPKVYTVEVKVSKPLITASKAAARSARKKGYDSVIFYGEDLVSGVPEVAVFDPSKVKIKSAEVEQTVYENPSLPSSIKVLYHGTRGDAGRAILSRGWIEPGHTPEPKYEGKEYSLRPLKGRVYVTSDPTAALEYALSPFGRAEGGWLFEVSADGAGSDVLIDEDELAEMIFDGRAPANLREFARRVVPSRVWNDVELHQDRAALASMGKLLMARGVLQTKRVQSKIMEASTRFAVAKPLRVLRAWKLNSDFSARGKEVRPLEWPGMMPVDVREARRMTNPSANIHPMSLQSFLRKPNPSRKKPPWSSGHEKDRREANFYCPGGSRDKAFARKTLLAAGVPKSEMEYYTATAATTGHWFAMVTLAELIEIDRILTEGHPKYTAYYEALDMTLHWDYQLTFDKTLQDLVGKKNPAAATAEKIITSAATSRPQVPALFKALVESGKIGMGSVVLDVGAGRYDLGKAYLEDHGIVSSPYDPYNRSEEENIQALNVARSGRVDACMCANVLNVIAYPDHRAHVIWLCANAVRASKASAWFSIHEGDRSGMGRVTGPDSWQENRKAVSYLKEIRQYFTEVQAKRLAGRTVIEASGPRSAA